MGLSTLTVVADFFLKKASQLPGFQGWRFLLLAILFYGGPAVGWLFVMRKLKFSTIGVIYGITTVLCIVAIAVFYFREKISPIEAVGIAMAVGSMILLARFS